MEQIKALIYLDDGNLSGLGRVIYSGLLLVIAFILTCALRAIIKRAFKSKLMNGTGRELKRFKTVMGILKSIATTIIFIIWFIMTLGVFGIDTKAIVATAGISGLAIGFAAKSFIEDIINGMFLMIENVYNVGDYINIADRNGTVEEVSLRTTTIRDFNGDLHVIPNGLIKIVTNRSRNIQRALVQFQIAYEENTEDAVRLLDRVLKESVKNDKAVVEMPTVLGVTALRDSSVEITVICYTVPGEQWRIERMMREVGRVALKNNNIEIPYNKLDVKISGDKDA